MNEIRETAERLFNAVESGKGWEHCKAYCHPGATFSSQAASLADVDTIEGYAAWIQNTYSTMPDAHYDLRCFAVDEDRQVVAAYAIFRGTHTGDGGPVAPTGRQTASDYVHVMEFDNGKVRHMTKIWNDAFAMQQLGWA